MSNDPKVGRDLEKFVTETRAVPGRDQSFCAPELSFQPRIARFSTSSFPGESSRQPALVRGSEKRGEEDFRGGDKQLWLGHVLENSTFMRLPQPLGREQLDGVRESTGDSS